MYRFNIGREDNGAWRFELDGINMILDGFFIKDGKRWIVNPNKAIAFFKTDGVLYGVSNNIKTFSTVEDFYDIMHEQYMIFKNDGDFPENENMLRHSA